MQTAVRDSNSTTGAFFGSTTAMLELKTSSVSRYVNLEACFSVVLFAALLLEFYVNILPEVKRLMAWCLTAFMLAFGRLPRFLSSITKHLKDYSSGRYYLPWSGYNTVVLKESQIDDHIRELSDNSQLSQRAVYADIFGFQYNMRNGSTALNPEEQSPHRYRLFSTVIRKIGISQLAELAPFLHAASTRACSLTIDSSPQDSEGWHDVKLMSFMKQCSTDLLGIYFYGESLYRDPEFYNATQQFYQDVMKCMGVLQFTPKLLKNSVYKYMTNSGHALNVIHTRLNAIISNPEIWNEDEELKELTMLHHFIENTRDSEYWTPGKLIQAITGIWFAASHQPFMNLHFVMLELCQRPDYLKELREEIAQMTTLDLAAMSKLPKLDSFIKECVRLNPLDRVAIRRKALNNFQFSHEGPAVKKGTTVCIDAWGIMHRPSLYPDPDTFDGFRFVGERKGSSTRGSTFTDASKEFPIWGYGSRVCPGRWHADAAFKISMVQILSNYDFRLQNPEQRHMFWWETWQMPFESTIVQFRKRDKPVLASTTFV